MSDSIMGVDMAAAPKIFRVKYRVMDTCSIEVEAEDEMDAQNKVLLNAFCEDETYGFLGAEIHDVLEVEKLE